MEPETFECTKCGKRYPTYIDGKLNIATAGNLEGFTFQICYNCYTIPTAEEAIEMIDLWINPIREPPCA